jgi:transposase InsO family protein
LHIDTARYARFERPGHRVTGDRSQPSRKWMDPGTRVGYDFAHAIVDDHSRLAYVELHNDERAETVTGFVTRALDWFAEHGIHAKRLMSDNAWTYTHNRSLRELLADRQIKHLRTKPYRPQTNGKVERFHQTMAREWAYGLAYRSHRHRNQALPHWIEHYNQRRPHSGIGNQPPISRVHNLREQDSQLAQHARTQTSQRATRTLWRRWRSMRPAPSRAAKRPPRMRLIRPRRRSLGAAVATAAIRRAVCVLIVFDEHRVI